MRSWRSDDLNLVQESVRWYQTAEMRERYSLPDYQESFYTRMLIQDTHSGVMPYRGMSKWPLSARIEPSGAEELIEKAISGNDYRTNLYDVISKFVQDCTSWMMTYGKAISEIAYLHDADDKPVAFELIDVLPESIKTRNGKLVQCIPESKVHELELTGDIIGLTLENFIIFELPLYVRDGYRPMMDSLYALGRHATLPEFVVASMKGGIPPVPFEFDKFGTGLKLAVADSTKLIGWNARQNPNQGITTEYYYLYRFLLFEKFKFELRDSIISRLNEAISRAGEKLGFTGQIVVDGLLGLQEIRQAQQALAQGSAKFQEVLKPFLAYET